MIHQCPVCKGFVIIFHGDVIDYPDIAMNIYNQTTKEAFESAFEAHKPNCGFEDETEFSLQETDRITSLLN